LFWGAFTEQKLYNLELHFGKREKEKEKEKRRVGTNTYKVV